MVEHLNYLAVGFQNVDTTATQTEIMMLTPLESILPSQLVVAIHIGRYTSFVRGICIQEDFE